MTYTLRVSADPGNETQKHVELLKNGDSVLADFFSPPLSLEVIGVELMERYDPPSGLYNLDGTPYQTLPKEEHEYPEEDFFPSST